MTDYGVDRLDGLPERVTICEVGPRDGLQNEATILPVEVKVEFIERLVDAGHTVVETTSFVHPKWVPQLADAEQVLDRLDVRPGVRYPVLVPAPQVVSVASRMMALGCSELSLGDTIGVATPGRVAALLAGVVAASVPIGQAAVHFHDTYGQALTLEAMRHGVTTIDASAGGLGGCPYAKSATGNLATEDLLWQLNGLGIDTGVNLAKLVETSSWLAQRMGRPGQSRTVRAVTGV